MMKIKKLELKNFRGAKDLTLDFNDDLTTISGGNGTGKTTIANAYSYLLTDKPYVDEKGFTPKTIIGEKEVSGLNHIVVGTFENDGKEIALSKDYHEVWTKQRGSAEATLTGHTTDYKINGVPKKLKEYNEFVEEHFGDSEEVNMITNPTYFAEIDWKRRRDLLLEILGGVSDEEILADMPDLEKELDGHTVEDLLEIKKSEKRTVNKALQNIPARIDEASRAKPDVPTTKKHTDEVKSKIKELEQEIKAHDSDQGNSKQITELRAKIAELEIEKGKKIRHLTNAQDGKRNALQNELRVLEEDWYRLETSSRRAELGLKDLEAKKSETEEGRENITSRWQAIKAETYDGSNLCPTCSRELPSEQIEEAIENFNADKAKRLEQVLEEGKKNFSKEKLESIISQIEITKTTVETDKQSLTNLKPAIADLKTKIKLIDYEDLESAEINKLDKEIQILQSKIERLDNDPTQDLTKVNELKSELISLQNELAEIEVAKTQIKRIKELEDEEAQLGLEFSNIERVIFLIEEFQKAKSSALITKINSKFKNSSFQLFEEQVNGGIKEICEVLVRSKEGNLIPWKSANTGGRINAGLEIINVLCEHYDNYLPIVIDGTESIEITQETKSQLINLEVRKGEPLKLEGMEI